MKTQRICLKAILTLSIVCAIPAMCASCSGNNNSTQRQSRNAEQHNRKDGKVGGPQLGTPGGGPVIDKSSDMTLQALIENVAPKFKQFVYKDKETGKSMRYNLYSPQCSNRDKQYPLVLFMADASTPGSDATRPLTQGYGALVWATDESQAKNPCYVLVPQFSGVAVNDAYEHTEEVDMVIRLLKDIVNDNDIDSNRLYTTGQSMGGMISMYYNITYPDLFAASIFVDCHWDTEKFEKLAKHTFTFITAGKNGSSFGNILALEKAADKDGVKYEYSTWSAKLPQAEQDSLAQAMLSKGATINIINFTPKSVLPADGKGSEHMYSFDYAYKLSPIREWLFKIHK